MNTIDIRGHPNVQYTIFTAQGNRALFEAFILATPAKLCLRSSLLCFAPLSLNGWHYSETIEAFAQSTRIPISPPSREYTLPTTASAEAQALSLWVFFLALSPSSAS